MSAHDALSAWENFYVIVGSSAGALTGLQFVVMAIVSQSTVRTGTHEISTFGTPTVFHFCAVLVVSAIISAPWPDLRGAAIALTIGGVFGIGYTVIVIRRTQRTVLYKPVMEDWIFHCVFPFMAYLLLAVAGAMLARRPLPALFGIATFALLLLFIGIRNAWDTATYVAVALFPSSPDQERTQPPS